MNRNELFKRLIIDKQGKRCFECARNMNMDDVGGFRVIKNSNMPMTIGICKQCFDVDQPEIKTNQITELIE